MGIATTRRPTKKRFIEFNPEGDDSLERWHDVFLAHCDPTEYKAAMELAGTWAEWERFKREWPGFNTILNTWLEEVEIKIRSDAVHELVKKVPTDASAAKFLAEGKYKEKVAGKPSKARREREMNVQRRVASVVDLEVERVLNPDVKEVTL